MINQGIHEYSKIVQKIPHNPWNITLIFVQQLVILEYSPCITNCLFVVWSVKAFTGRVSLGYNKFIFGVPLRKKGLETQFWRHMLLYSLLPSILPGCFGPEPSWFYCLSITHLQNYALYSCQCVLQLFLPCGLFLYWRWGNVFIQTISKFLLDYITSPSTRLLYGHNCKNLNLTCILLDLRFSHQYW